MGAYIYESSIKNWIKKWAVFIIPVVLFAVPQLLFWIFAQAESYLRINIDWVNQGDMWLWFWIKNIGLPFILIVPALIYADDKKRLWFVSASVIFAIAEVIAFQPNEYDNNKLMLIWYVFVVMIVSDYLIMLYNKLKKTKGIVFISVFTCIVLFLSGTLTIGREIYSNGQYRQYSQSQVECAQSVDESTLSDALFITGHQHLNEIAALAGRNIYAGSTIYVFFHGLDYTARYEQIAKIYEDALAAPALLEEIGADYIYISSYERNDFLLDYDLYDYYPLVYSSGNIDILAVSARAIENGTIFKED